MSIGLKQIASMANVHGHRSISQPPSEAIETGIHNIATSSNSKKICSLDSDSGIEIKITSLQTSIIGSNSLNHLTIICAVLRETETLTSLSCMICVVSPKEQSVTKNLKHPLEQLTVMRMSVHMS